MAELRFHSTAFGAAVNGAAEANSISPDTSANATGTASWFRALKSDGATAVFDGSIGTSFSNIVLSSTSITAGETVDITTFTYTPTHVAMSNSNLLGPYTDTFVVTASNGVTSTNTTITVPILAKCLLC